MKNENNTFILDGGLDMEILKSLALTNNELILIDNEYLKDTHRLLANKIIKFNKIK